MALHSLNKHFLSYRDNPVDRHSKGCLAVIAFALLFSSCAKPAAPPPSTMAFVVIPKPERNQVASTSQAIPTPTSIPTPRIITVSIWTPPYLAETFGSLLEDPLKALFVSDAAAAECWDTSEEGSTEPDQSVDLCFGYSVLFNSSGPLKRRAAFELAGRINRSICRPAGINGYQNTYEMLSAVWGPAADARVNVMAKNDLVDYAWTHQPAWAIVPFESLVRAGSPGP